MGAAGWQIAGKSPAAGRTHVLLALAIGSLLLYGRSLNFDFVDFDDRTILLGHPGLYGGDDLLANLRMIFFDYFPREEPLLLRDLSWLLDSWLWGFDNPFGYHLGNLLLNALNVVLLFFVIEKSGLDFALAFWVAAAFALLPIHVEPICWVMGRKDLLSSALLLIALSTQCSLLAGTARRRWFYYGIGLVSTCLAPLAKISAVTFFAVLGLHRFFWPYLRGERSAQASFPLAELRCAFFPYLLPHFTFAVGIFLGYQRILSEFGLFGRGPDPLSLTHLKTLSVYLPLTLAKYLELLFFPFDYAPWYARPNVALAPEAMEWMIAGPAVVGVAALGVWLLRRRRDLLFYYLTFFVLMVPYMNLEYIGIWVADRYLYLSSFCLVVLAVSFLLEVWRRAPRAGRLVVVTFAASVLLINGLSAFLSQAAWRNTRSLWAYAAATEYPSMLALQGLARSYWKEASTEQDPERRAQLLVRAEERVRIGIATYQERNYRDSPYFTDAPGNYAKLHNLRGRIARLGGAAPEVVLRLYQEAHDLAPESYLSAYYMADGHFEVALSSGLKGPEGLEHARRSLAYFEVYIRGVRYEPEKYAEALGMLSTHYGRHMPELEPEIRALRARHRP